MSSGETDHFRELRRGRKIERRFCAIFHPKRGSWVRRLPPSQHGDIPSTSDRPTTCARGSRSPTYQAAVQKTSPPATNMATVAKPPRVLVEGLRASIRRARERAQAGESEGMGDEACNLRHQPGASDSTVRKGVCSDWYWSLHSTTVVQTPICTVEARRDLSICLASSSSVRGFSGSSR